LNSKKIGALSPFITALSLSQAVVAQPVERELPKLKVAGSNPVYRSKQQKISMRQRMLTWPLAFRLINIIF
jgi:hypothetical protein